MRRRSSKSVFDDFSSGEQVEAFLSLSWTERTNEPPSFVFSSRIHFLCLSNRTSLEIRRTQRRDVLLSRDKREKSAAAIVVD